MTELKLWYMESYELNENYWVIAESDDEAIELVKQTHKDAGLDDEYDVAPVDYYNLVKQVITQES